MVSVTFDFALGGKNGLHDLFRTMGSGADPASGTDTDEKWPGVQIAVTISLQAGQPELTLKWSPGKDSCTIGDVLEAMGAGFRLPPVVDLNLPEFTVEYRPIRESKRLWEGESRRLTLRCASVVLCWSVTDAGGRSAARVKWDAVSFGALPVIGDRLKPGLGPMALVLASGPSAVKVKKLMNLLEFAQVPGLETLGYTAAELAKDPQIDPGLHCAGTFAVDPLISITRCFPLYRFSKPPHTLAAPHAPAGDGFEESGKATSSAVQRSIGPLHLGSVGFKLDHGTVSVLLNVSLHTAGLTLDLTGLRAGFNISDKSFIGGLDGILVGYQQGAVQIAGGLIRDTSQDATQWFGTAMIRVGDKFCVQAIGAFKDDGATRLFLFGYDRQQMGGPVYCNITGLAAGFGLNRTMRVPAVDKVGENPMVKIASDLDRGGAGPGVDLASPDPDKLNKLVEGMKDFLPDVPTSDSFFVFGLTFTSFGFIHSTVLGAVQFGSTLRFLLLGSSLLDAPKGNPIAHAELFIVASVTPGQGIASIDGVLAPGSYVLSKDCHLTGGFAFYLWFGQDHGGDFVLTLGGYHPAYQKPPHYPSPPRLAFTWQISGDLRMSGWSYFALTPASVQAGGALDIVLESGPLRAWCHSEAHLWINWAPFFYDVRIHVDLGVSFRLDLPFCTETISLDVSADLHLWGPDFSGHADIHLWFVSFGVDFGAGQSRTPVTMSWGKFLDAVAPPRARALKAAASTEAPNLLDIVPLAGLRAAEKGADQPDWYGDPERVEFHVVSLIPATGAKVNSAAVTAPGDGALKIYAKPLLNGNESKQIDPQIAVTVTLDNVEVGQIKADARRETVPSALWGNGVAASGQETIPAIRKVRIYTRSIPAEETVDIPVSRLAFDDVRVKKVLTWATPAVSTSPIAKDLYDTIDRGDVRDARDAVLCELHRILRGTPQIDVKNIRRGGQAFMTSTNAGMPIVCSLGAEIPPPAVRPA